MKKRMYSLVLVLIMLFSAISFAEEREAVSTERVEFDSELYKQSLEEKSKNDNDLDGIRTSPIISSEERFQQGIGKKEMDRKEAFSYENKGYGPMYDIGPSYEGYSKEQMIFGMVFEHIGEDIDPRDIKEYCNEPERIADIVISKFRERVGDSNKICKRIDEEEAKCNENSKKSCDRIGTPVLREDSTEIEKINAVAYSCPVNKDAIIEACKIRNKYHLEQRIKNADETCKERFNFEGERLIKECERFKQSQICDKDKYVNQCLRNFGVRKEDFNRQEQKSDKGFRYAKWQCYDGYSESQGDETSCKTSEVWSDYARKSCEGHCYEDKSKCGVNSFSVSGECGVSISKPAPCPAYPVPQCSEGILRTKIDNNGCVYYYCESVQTNVCPTASIPLCVEGYTVQKKVDEKGCMSYYCEKVRIVCPTPITPTCAEGTTLQKKTDTNGCVYYYCEATPTTSTKPAKLTMEGSDGTWCYDSDSNGGYFSKGYCQDNSATYNDFCDGDTVRDYYCTGTWDGSKWSRVKCEHGGYVCSSGGYKCSDGACIKTEPICPSITKPTCAADETIQAYYDNAECVSSYQCIKQIMTCPVVQKPDCSEGQSLTTNYDEKGCIIAYECFSVSTTNTSSTAITGQVVLNTYDDFVRQCEISWLDQQRGCLNFPNVCDKETFIERCKEQERKSYEDSKSNIERYCEKDTTSEVTSAEQRCQRIDEDRKRCFEEGSKRCEQMKGIAEKCRETLTDENLRKSIIEEVKKRCKFTEIIGNEKDLKKAEKAEIVVAVLKTATEKDMDKLSLFVEDLEEELKLQDTIVYKGTIDPNRFGNVKLFPFVVNAKISTVVSAERAKEVKAKIVSSEKVEEAAKELVSLRDSDVPKEYLYIIEDKASEIVDVSDELEEQDKIEAEKGIGYKFKRFLGLAQKQEQEEMEQLKKNIDKLESSINALSKVAEEVPSDVAKAIIKEQIENLIAQKEDILKLIESKERKAKGFLALFG